MEPPSDSFIFSAQPPPIQKSNVDSSHNLENVGIAKRARAELDVLGRSDVIAKNSRRDAMGSFKSKLMTMASPSSWSGAGNSKEKLRIDHVRIPFS